MDGNRRWAKEQNLGTVQGHKKGGEVFLDVVRWVRNEKIPHAVFYAFSTENWNRPAAEVEYLMELALEHAKKLKKRLAEDVETGSAEVGVRFRFIGNLSRFSKQFQTLVKEIEEESVENIGTTIWVALSYGGRAEIVSAANDAIKKGEEVDEGSFKKLMWSSEMPDPDLIVRTGGQQRLSNFLTWQSAYSEYVFLKKYWPEITTEDLETLVKEFGDRNRTFGK